MLAHPNARSTMAHRRARASIGAGQRVNVRGASSLTDGSLVHEILELMRKKLPGVVGVKRTTYALSSTILTTHMTIGVNMSSWSGTGVMLPNMPAAVLKTGEKAAAAM